MRKPCNIFALALILIPLAVFPVSFNKYKRIHASVLKTYNRLAFSSMKWRITGRSRWRQPVYYKIFGKGEKTVLIIGGIHGDEPSGGMAVVKLAERLRKLKKKLPGTRVVLIPFLNPDGLHLMSRTNARKVDINRNFPSPTWKTEHRKTYNYPGMGPASEPETRIVMKAIEKYKPALIIQMHQPFNKLYPDKNVPQELAKRISDISGLSISDDIGYETPGSMGSYAASFEKKYPMITFELGEIDEIPEYDKIVNSLIFAIKYHEKK